MAEKLPEKREEEKGLGRLIGGAVIALFVILFAAFNFDRVEVNWVLFTRDSRLIYVIIVSAVLGALADRLMTRRARERKKEG